MFPSIFLLYLFIGFVVWFFVAVLNYGELNKSPFLKGVIETEVDKNSQIGFISSRINEISNKHKKTHSYHNPQSETNAVGFLIIITIWPIILVVARIRHSQKSR